MSDALEQCVNQLHAAAVHAKQNETTEPAFKAQLRKILKEYYKEHTIEILCHIHENMSVGDIFEMKCEGTD